MASVFENVGTLSTAGSALGLMGGAGTAALMTNPVTLGLAAGLAGFSALSSMGQAKDEMRMIDSQLSGLGESKTTLASLHGQKLDLAEDRYDQGITDLSAKSGASLYDALRGGEQIKAQTGFAGVGAGITGSDRAESQVRRGHDMTAGSMETAYGQEVFGLEQQYAGEDADLDLQMKKLEYERKQAKSKQGFGGFFKSMLGA